MKNVISHKIEVLGETGTFNVDVALQSENDGVSIYDINFSSAVEAEPQKVTLKWKVPALNVKGIWKPTADFAKRIMADWELLPVDSRVSIDSPVISLFGHDDSNAITFACSDAINTIELDAVYREEDDFIYCQISFFTERYQKISNYTAQVRIDQKSQHFGKSIEAVGQWWSTFKNLKPTPVPSLAKKPVYSTWYNYHQALDEDQLLRECKIAADLGYELIILDDGWQTMDENRGYDYTGDWEPDRFPDVVGFVKKVHDTGMKIAFWYSVPFCGQKSKAYQKFKGKFLTEDHRWAPVFDPRYPEVRKHLIDIYVHAITEWKLDGFKLDFIDDFKVYPETVLTQEDGRDYSSVNEAVDRLLTDVINALRAVNPDVVIEFRQKYTGPAMRKYGNMFRAFDCPGDSAMNRLRIADIRMLAGNTAVHSDMFTYHNDDTVENKALQVVNTLFGVPQLSIVLEQATEQELAMLRFYTKYWNDNADALINGEFIASKPLANYPIVKSKQGDTTIIGVYDDYIVDLNEATNIMDIINGQITTKVILNNTENYGAYHCEVFDCMGEKVNELDVMLLMGVLQIKVPPCGLIRLQKSVG